MQWLGVGTGGGSGAGSDCGVECHAMWCDDGLVSVERDSGEV